MEHQKIKTTEAFKEHLDWVFEGGKPIWERCDVQRVISMAACIVDGHLIVGNRHFCPIMRMQLEHIGVTGGKHDVRTDQGFVCQWGIYMSRQEAWEVAKAAGQIKQTFEDGVLYSECYL